MNGQKSLKKQWKISFIDFSVIFDLSSIFHVFLSRNDYIILWNTERW